MQSDQSVIGQRVLYQEVRVSTLSLGEFLVALVKIDTITLNPGRHPCLVLGVGLAVREIELVVQVMILGIQSQHLEQVNVSRACGYYAVHQRVTSQQIVDQQGVRSRDVTMNGIVIDTVAIGIVVEAAGRADLIVKYPCRFIVCLDGGLHEQGTAKHVGHVTVKALYIF